MNNSKDGDHYSWDFGDGSTSEVASTSHAYTNAGIYIVTLTAYSKNGKKSDAVSQTIIIGSAPVCSITYLPKFPKPNEATQFTDNSTNSPLSWSWNFGDGSTSSDKNPIHAFPSENNYTVSLTVTSNFGTSSQSVIVSVLNQTPLPPVANYSYSVNGTSVGFTDLSTGNPISWLWTFGDGTTSTQQNSTHQYSQTGTYTVTLKVTSMAGSNQISKSITLSSYSFLAGSYSVVDVSNGYTTNYTDNNVASTTVSDKFYTQKFGSYSGAIVYFLVNGTSIDIPQQTVTCGLPPNNIPHTFNGSGYYTTSPLKIYITYVDQSTLGTFSGCTGTYTKLKGKFKQLDTKDKSWYLLQQQKNRISKIPF